MALIGLKSTAKLAACTGLSLVIRSCSVGESCRMMRRNAHDSDKRPPSGPPGPPRGAPPTSIDLEATEISAGPRQQPGQPRQRPSRCRPPRRRPPSRPRSRNQRRRPRAGTASAPGQIHGAAHSNRCISRRRSRTPASRAYGASAAAAQAGRLAAGRFAVAADRCRRRWRCADADCCLVIGGLRPAS